MKGIKVGYKRVSSIDQNPDRQLSGIELDKIFVDKVSGSNLERPQLKSCLDYMREGDTLIVHSIDRLARNLVDLLNTIQSLLCKRISIQFVKENLEFKAGEQENPFQKLQLQIIGSVAEFERALIRERQREGIEKAKQAGKHLGRPTKVTPEMKKLIFQMIGEGKKKTAIASDLGVSRQSIYRLINNPLNGKF